MSNFKLIVINTGHAGASSVGTALFKYKYVIDGSVEDALSNLTTRLFEAWWWSTWRTYSKKERRWRYFSFYSFRELIKNLPGLTANDFSGEGVRDWDMWPDWSEVASVPLEQTVRVFGRAENLLPLYVNLAEFDSNPLESKEVFDKTKEVYLRSLRRGYEFTSVEKDKQRLLELCCKTWQVE